MNADILAVACAYLRADTTIAGIAGDRVATRTPATTDTPWIRATLLDERTDERVRVLHLTRSLLQLDCYAGQPRDYSQSEASLLARAARQALSVMHQTAHEGAVVTRAVLGSMQHLPDETLAPARERYILTVEIHAHP